MFLAFIPIIGTLASSLLVSPALTLGAYIVSHNIATEGNTDFGKFFDGFKKASDIIVAYLIIFAIAIIVFGALGLLIFTGANLSSIMEGDYSSLLGAGWMIFLVIIPVIYLSVLTSYTVPFIYFYDLSGLDALKYSARFVHSQWIWVFLFAIVVGLLVSLGMIALIIGIVFTIGFYYTMFYSSFAGITRLDDYLNEEKGDGVMDMLIED